MRIGIHIPWHRVKRPSRSRIMVVSAVFVVAGLAGVGTAYALWNYNATMPNRPVGVGQVAVTVTRHGDSPVTSAATAEAPATLVWSASDAVDVVAVERGVAAPVTVGLQSE
ncbi:MAG: hypothetical protein LBH76_10445, partial [Propionibacteriaceae bacterium]|nr:hypothetical protein [Propionibacteriaceae bacterium]